MKKKGNAAIEVLLVFLIIVIAVVGVAIVYTLESGNLNSFNSQATNNDNNPVVVIQPLSQFDMSKISVSISGDRNVDLYPGERQGVVREYASITNDNAGEVCFSVFCDSSVVGRESLCSPNYDSAVNAPICVDGNSHGEGQIIIGENIENGIRAGTQNLNIEVSVLKYLDTESDGWVYASSNIISADNILVRVHRRSLDREYCDSDFRNCGHSYS